MHIPVNVKAILVVQGVNMQKASYKILDTMYVSIFQYGIAKQHILASSNSCLDNIDHCLYVNPLF